MIEFQPVNLIIDHKHTILIHNKDKQNHYALLNLALELVRAKSVFLRYNQIYHEI